MNPAFPPEPPPPARILVRGVNWLGDAVMTTPALLRLRERFPAAHITLSTPVKLRDLWQAHPAINETLTFEAGESVFSVGRRLRAGHFDLAVVLPNSPRAALEVWLARIPRRIGLARPWRNGFLTEAVPPRPGAVEMRKRGLSEIRNLITTGHAAMANCQPARVDGQPESSGHDQASAIGCQPSAFDPASHHLHQYLHLAAALGAEATPLPPHLAVAETELQAAMRTFGLDLVDGAPPLFLGLNPGAEYGPAKRWPADRFAEAAAQVQRRTPCRWLVFGGAADAALAEKITADIRYEAERPPTSGQMPPGCAAVNLAGRTTLRELMALLKLCRVLLTNDTGPMHVAAALGTPVVVPFGSTAPELTGPGLPGDPRHRLLKSAAPCAPCFLRECPVDFRCMNSLTPGRVATTVMEALNC